MRGGAEKAVPAGKASPTAGKAGKAVPGLLRDLAGSAVGRGGGADRPRWPGFGWLWAAYAVSTAGTWLAFGAFPLIAILVLHAGRAQVSLLSAAGLAVGALIAVPLGPWVEFRRKRPVMVAMDLLRFAALLTVPAAYALGLLTFAQLAGGLGGLGGGQHRLHRGERGVPEGARARRRTCSSPTAGSRPRPGPRPRSGRRSAGPRSGCSAR